MTPDTLTRSFHSNNNMKTIPVSGYKVYILYNYYIYYIIFLINSYRRRHRRSCNTIRSVCAMAMIAAVYCSRLAWVFVKRHYIIYRKLIILYIGVNYYNPLPQSSQSNLTLDARFRLVNIYLFI